MAFVLAACTAFEMEHFPPELRALAESMGSPVELHFDLPQAEVVKLEDCAHSPHRDQADAVLDAVKTFMAQLPSHQP